LKPSLHAGLSALRSGLIRVYAMLGWGWRIFGREKTALGILTMFSHLMTIVLTTDKQFRFRPLLTFFPEAAFQAARFGSALVTTKCKCPELLTDTATALD
jgi:hypothetical protein